MPEFEKVVIFGTGEILPRYPEAPPVPRTVLINPVITPLSDAEENDWEGCLSVPGMRGLVPRWSQIRYTGFDQWGDPIERVAEGFLPEMARRFQEKGVELRGCELTRALIDASGREIRLEIDGGVNVQNIREIAEAGADTFVAGSAIFNQPDYKAVIDAMRAELAQVRG